MNVNKKFFYLLLFIVILLVLAAAFLLRSSYQQQPQEQAPSAAPSALAEGEPAVSSDDFMLMLEHPQAEGLPSAAEILGRSQQQGAAAPRLPARQVPAGAMSAPQAAALSYAQRPQGAVFPQPRVSANQGNPFPSASYGNTSSRPLNYSLGSSGVQPGAVALAGRPADVAEYQQGAQGRQNMLASATPTQTWQQQKKLNSQLQGFSAGLERAIASAMMPKSKRQQNIEKYLNRSRGEAAQMDDAVYGAENKQAGGPAAQVMRQLAAQAQSIVNDVRSSYGDKAAEGAQSIMNDFQKEMSDTLNAPGDPQEKQIRASAVNNKYNKKLQQFNDQQAFGRLAQQLQQEDEKYLQKIAQTYGPETEAAARVKLNEDRAQRLAVYSKYQSEADATRQLLALDAKRQKDLEEVVRTTAKPGAMGNLTQMQNELAKERILQDIQDEKEGKKTSRLYREDAESRAQYEADWKEEGKKVVESFAAFGDKYAAEAQSLVNDLNNQRKAIRDTALEEGLSESQVYGADMKKTEETNKKIQELRTRALQDTFNQQNDQRLEAFTQNMQGVPDEVKQDWSQKARPVMEKYNQQRAELTSKVKNQQEYEEALKKLEEQEIKELQNIQVKMPQQQQQQP